MENSLPRYLYSPSDSGIIKGKGVNISFLDKTILGIARSVKSIYLQAESASGESSVQKINPYIKLLSLLYFTVIISLVRNLPSQLLISGFILVLYIITIRLKLFQVYRKIFIIAFVFGFLVVVPASLNVITPGRIILKLLEFNKPSQFWIYSIPREIGITDNGVRVVSMVFLRVLNSVSFALLIVFTTPFSSLIKSFKLLGIPDAFLMIVSLAYKFIFILSRSIEETYFALKSRLSGNLKSGPVRKLIGGRIFFTFKKSVAIYENTYYAMVSRGYTGKVKFYLKYRFSYGDIILLVIIAALGIIIVSI